ncbi:MAG TPA: putative maltokinase [Terriglobia bacterium]
MDSARNTSSRKWLADRLQPFLAQQRWFGGKARALSSVEILDVIPMSDDRAPAELVLASVKYADQFPDETYAVPLLTNRLVRPLLSRLSDSTLQLSEIENGTELQDALLDSGFLTLLLKAIDRGLIFRGEDGEVSATSTSTYQGLPRRSPNELRPTLLKVEQSNSSVIFGDRFILKLLRQAGEGVNPELEIGSFLTERARFANVPAVMGSIVYRSQASSRTIGILQSLVPNQGNAWEYTLRALSDYFLRVVQAGRESPFTQGSEERSGFGPQEAPAPALGLLGPYLQALELLGRRTAELHLALSTDRNDPNFAPEAFSASYRIELQRSLMVQWARTSQLLRTQLGGLAPGVRKRAQALLDLHGAVEQRLQALAELTLDGSLTRIHGDYHLGQVLCSNGDFVIIDFEGEPARPLRERRAKHSPLQDVAGMLRSLHYAADKGLREWLEAGKSGAVLSWPDWARSWKDSASAHFIGAYTDSLSNVSLLPSSPRASKVLLDVYLLGKATYELGYELNNRPDWVSIPLEGMLEILCP